MNYNIVSYSSRPVPYFPRLARGRYSGLPAVTVPEQTCAYFGGEIFLERCSLFVKCCRRMAAGRRRNFAPDLRFPVLCGSRDQRKETCREWTRSISTRKRVGASARRESDGSSCGVTRITLLSLYLRYAAFPWTSYFYYFLVNPVRFQQQFRFARMPFPNKWVSLLHKMGSRLFFWMFLWS